MEKKDTITNVDYDDLPQITKKKLKKYYEQQSRKHPRLSEQRIMDKMAKKFKVKFEF